MRCACSILGRSRKRAATSLPSDAACAYRVGECLAACGHLTDARDALQVALKLCGLPKTDPSVRVLTLALLDRLN